MTSSAPNDGRKHSFESQLHDDSIAHLFPPSNNYIISPTDPTRRSPKSLMDLCIDSICRNAADFETLPPGIPRQIVERIMRTLTSNSALSATTLTVLRHNLSEVSALLFAVCGLRFAVCGLRFAVCDLRITVCCWRFSVTVHSL